MSSSQPIARGSASLDWEGHRHLITSLYIGEDMTQKDVEAFMKRHHQFHATKFSEWGLEKNLEKKDVLHVLQQADLEDLPGCTPVRIRERNVPLKKLRRHVKRNKALQEKLAGTTSSTYETAAAPDGSSTMRACTKILESHKQTQMSMYLDRSHPRCWRCRILGLQCRDDGSDYLCYECLETALHTYDGAMMAFSDCIRITLLDVDVFDDGLSEVERVCGRAEAVYPELDHITLDFDIKWDLDYLVQDTSGWLSKAVHSNTSKVGACQHRAFST
ncbi:uncharacterized protein AB675_1771 [Cyphellophora attinorum]|uniref:Clr5 domain-containing protein n=1 Tax=Cyphellophora attinorum TaxID=1664694 RepID=A0A0N1HTX6_9EURO|nr:uncharacterized protein AB675_1771 [Phialophora attinorum]KPI42656.1 hypothetical protein AB675_1771 [Phialophora attinorum]